MDKPWFMSLLIVFAAYLIGSIPFSFIVAKQAKGIDIRDHGSGNVGATNVMRTCGKKAGALAYLLDFLKGLLPVGLIRLIFPGNEWLAIAVGAALMLGHTFSIFLKFSGGKAAMTGVATVVAMSPFGGLLSILSSVLIMRLTKTVSIGSIFGGFTIGLWTLLAEGWGERWPAVIYAGLAGFYVVIKHRSNMLRLLKGTENTLGPSTEQSSSSSNGEAAV